MSKVKVTIEEHLSKTVEIEVPDKFIQERDTVAILDLAALKYENKEIVLDLNDFNGTKLIAITDDKIETEFEEF